MIAGLIGSLGGTAATLFSLSLILFAGALFSRLARLARLPDVTGYICAGILIGPSVLDLVPHDVIAGMGFLSDLALAFIAFGVGRFFKKEVLKETGPGVIVITLAESLAAGLLITPVMHFLFGFSWSFSLLLGAIATATAPASTMMTIAQYKAKGPFISTLLQVVALDDVVCLLLFSVVSAVLGMDGDSVSVLTVLLPILYNLAAIVMGALLGFLLFRVAARISRDRRLILTIALLLLLSALCAFVDISPLLSCMVFGAVYVNLSQDKKLHKRISRFTPPIMSLFFVVSGMNLDLAALKTVGAAGVCYFLVRILGKYAGAWIGAAVTRSGPVIRRWLGLALIPQAGVAIGLAFLGKRMLPEPYGSELLTLILASSVLYELIGPACAKLAIRRSGSCDRPAKAEESEAENTDGPDTEEQPLS